MLVWLNQFVSAWAIAGCASATVSGGAQKRLNEEGKTKGGTERARISGQVRKPGAAMGRFQKKFRTLVDSAMAPKTFPWTAVLFSGLTVPLREGCAPRTRLN